MLENQRKASLRLVDAIVGSDWPNEEDRRQARLIAGVVNVMTIPGLLYLIHFVGIGLWWMAASVASTIVTANGSLFWLRRSKAPVTAGIICASAFFLLLTTSAYSTGGFYGPNFS